ncbi:O-methyltransferase [Enterococcus sp. DIV1059_2]|uniref:O-methyltransferase n=1 Tax=Enterococcus sp. DIV1059_2 TaxID=2774664 RepID=UPI003F1FA1EF
MSAQPFYHLRPNKFIDRQVFLNSLIKLQTYLDFSHYCYVGFGSYQFDDFKLMHNILEISNMISLECDPEIKKRAEFNKPFNCIEIESTTSTNFIDSFGHDKNNYIFWLDFTNPADIGKQFSDYCSLINQLEEGDILRITLNANPSSLGEKGDRKGEELWRERLEELKTRIGQYLPTDVRNDQLATKKYPLLLLSALKNATNQTLKESAIQKLFPVPILSSIYADGQQMVTLSILILDDHNKEKNILASLYPQFKHDDMIVEEVKNLVWNLPNKISIPSLSTKEILTMNSMLPVKDAKEILKNEFSFIFEDEEKIDNYLNFYKIYPYFREVSF